MAPGEEEKPDHQHKKKGCDPHGVRERQPKHQGDQQSRRRDGPKQDHAGEFPPEFDLTAFVYFPKSYAALDPSLDWYKCEMLE